MTREEQWPKLRFDGGTIRYRLYAQDGSMIDMRCADTPSMRQFVDWVQVHDRYTENAE